MLIYFCTVPRKEQRYIHIYIYMYMIIVSDHTYSYRYHRHQHLIPIITASRSLYVYFSSIATRRVLLLSCYYD